MTYDLKTDGLAFAKNYLNTFISTTVKQLPIVFPPKIFANYIIISVVSALLFWLIFKFFFGKSW